MTIVNQNLFMTLVLLGCHDANFKHTHNRNSPTSDLIGDETKKIITAGAFYNVLREHPRSVASVLTTHQ